MANKQASSSKQDISQIRSPIHISGKPAEQIINSIHYGSPELRCLLMDECNFIYECKVCHALFRDLPNFISHKRTYCTRSCADERHVTIANLPDEKVVVIQPQAPEETELQTPSQTKSSRSSKPNLEETIQRIQSGELGNSLGYKVYTEAAEKLQRQKEAMKVATIRTTPIPTNKNAVFVDVNVTSVNIHERQQANNGSPAVYEMGGTEVPGTVIKRKAGEKSSIVTTRKIRPVRNTVKEEKHSSEPQKLLMEQLKEIQFKVRQKASVQNREPQEKEKAQTSPSNGPSKSSNRLREMERRVRPRSTTQDRETQDRRKAQRNQSNGPRKNSEQVKEPEQKMRQKLATQNNEPQRGRAHTTPQSNNRSKSSEQVKGAEHKLRQKSETHGKEPQDKGKAQSNTSGKSPASSSIQKIDEDAKPTQPKTKSTDSADLSALARQNFQAALARVETRASAEIKKEDEESVGNKVHHRETVDSDASLHNASKVKESQSSIAKALMASKYRRKGKKSLMCTKCNYIFATNKSLHFHVKIHHSAKRTFYPCPYCPSEFYYFYGITRHLFNNHSKSMEEIDKMRDKIRERSYTKPFCPSKPQKEVSRADGARRSARTTAHSQVRRSPAQISTPAGVTSNVVKGKSTPKPEHAIDSGKPKQVQSADATESIQTPRLVKSDINMTQKKKGEGSIGKESSAESRSERLKQRNAGELEKRQISESISASAKTQTPSPAPSSTVSDGSHDRVLYVCSKCKRSFGRKISYENHQKICQGDSSVSESVVKREQLSTPKQAATETPPNVKEGRPSTRGLNKEQNTDVSDTESRSSARSSVRSASVKPTNFDLVKPKGRSRDGSNDSHRSTSSRNSVSSSADRTINQSRRSASVDRSRNRSLERNTGPRAERDSSVESTQSNTEGMTIRSHRNVLSRYSKHAVQSTKSPQMSDVSLKTSPASGSLGNISPMTTRGRKVDDSQTSETQGNVKTNIQSTTTEKTVPSRNRNSEITNRKFTSVGERKKAAGLPSKTYFSPRCPQISQDSNTDTSMQVSTSPMRHSSSPVKVSDSVQRSSSADLKIDSPQKITPTTNSVSQDGIKTEENVKRKLEMDGVKSEEGTIHASSDSKISDYVTTETAQGSNQLSTGNINTPSSSDSSRCDEMQAETPPKVTVVSALTERPKRKRKVPSRNKDAEEMLSKIHRHNKEPVPTKKAKVEDEIRLDKGARDQINNDKNVIGQIHDDKNVIDQIHDDKNIIDQIHDDKNVIDQIHDDKNVIDQIHDDKNVVDKIHDDKNVLEKGAVEEMEKDEEDDQREAGEDPLSSQESRDELDDSKEREADEEGEEEVDEMEEDEQDSRKGRQVSNRVYVLESSDSKAKKLRCYDLSRVYKLIDEENLKCLVCGESCSQVYNIRRHVIRQHLKWSRFKCKLCKFECYDRSECTTHIIRGHRGSQYKTVNPFIIDLVKQGCKARSQKKSQTIRVKRQSENKAGNIYARPVVKRLQRPSLRDRSEGKEGKSHHQYVTRNRDTKSSTPQRDMEETQTKTAVKSHESKQSVPSKLADSPTKKSANVSPASGVKANTSKLQTACDVAQDAKAARKILPFNISTRNSPRVFDIRPYDAKSEDSGTTTKTQSSQVSSRGDSKDLSKCGNEESVEENEGADDGDKLGIKSTPSESLTSGHSLKGRFVKVYNKSAPAASTSARSNDNDSEVESSQKKGEENVKKPTPGSPHRSDPEKSRNIFDNLRRHSQSSASSESNAGDESANSPSNTRSRHSSGFDNTKPQGRSSATKDEEFFPTFQTTKIPEKSMSATQLYVYSKPPSGSTKKATAVPMTITLPSGDNPSVPSKSELLARSLVTLKKLGDQFSTPSSHAAETQTVGEAKTISSTHSSGLEKIPSPQQRHVSYSSTSVMTTRKAATTVVESSGQKGTLKSQESSSTSTTTSSFILNNTNAGKVIVYSRPADEKELSSVSTPNHPCLPSTTSSSSSSSLSSASVSTITVKPKDSKTQQSSATSTALTPEDESFPSGTFVVRQHYI